MSLAEFHRGRSSAENLAVIAMKKHDIILETATHARGPAVLVALLTIGASLAVLILGLAGFVFFRTWI